MSLRVQVVFIGEPFNRDAVIHTLRHLAMRADWQLTLDVEANRRIIYATIDDVNALNTEPGDIVILSSRTVAEHLQNSCEPIPITEVRGDGLSRLLPFSHRAQNANWICADVIAGAFATMNLWYEERTRANKSDGWITWPEDWMARIGLTEPVPLADEWLDEIIRVAKRLNWATTAKKQTTKFTIVLTHDVDYLPDARSYGLPRLLRAVARQIVLRRRPMDAMRLFVRYAHMKSTQPYLAFDSVMRAERSRHARSSFQLVAARRHRFDPGYAIGRESNGSVLQKIAASDWEICLHGSYLASRTPGALAEERAELERVVGLPVRGHRQHYLNFHPSQLFDEVERAGLQYDMSVGYNDVSGPRTGTYFPYCPFNLEAGRAHNFWEMSFVLMDTTLATTYRFSPRQALQHSQSILSHVASRGGCISLIWHMEQLSGLVDPGFDQVYYDLLDWIRAQDGAMVTGRAVLSDLDTRWRATMVSDE